MKQDLENKVLERILKKSQQWDSGYVDNGPFLTASTGHDARGVLTTTGGLNTSNVILSAAVPATYTSAASIK